MPKFRDASIVLATALPMIAAASAAGAADVTPYLSASVGKFDHGLTEHSDSRDSAVDFRLEYRFGTSLLPMIENFATLRPFVGLEATSDAALYGVGGILLDVTFGQVFVTPSFGVGLYTRGNGKDLGHPIEFRSQIEVGYEFANEMRLSLAYSHLSNAGMDDLNPGADVIGAYLHVPVSSLFTP
ncbi:acyloxyacyl hydrolase [Arenibaculum sp.]|jgi:hypothetical protein|uniref:acyloxyacyl hydrolase n=1 Tax=Arenibaculum sp. TaxID=2865862 RepID=UPI002E126000|nr:acyloxyacyl hydrolase [Arenibaculum sp.]